MFQLSKETMEFLRHHDPMLHEQMAITFAPRKEYAPDVSSVIRQAADNRSVTANFYMTWGSSAQDVIDDDVVDGEYVEQ